MTILIVDDSTIMRNIVRNSLKLIKFGKHTVLEASNGEEAWLSILENKFDVVLLDWNMPGVDGLTLLKRIRADEQYKNLAVIMTTSIMDKTNVVQAIKAGATDYMIKPIREEQLEEKLLKVQDRILLASL